MTSERGASPKGLERRKHRRLEIRLPIECRRESSNGTSLVRTICRDVSTSGICFELDSPDFKIGDELRIELTVPSAEGVSPYPGRAMTRGQVVRVSCADENEESGKRSYSVAAQFLEKLSLSY